MLVAGMTSDKGTMRTVECERDGWHLYEYDYNKKGRDVRRELGKFLCEEDAIVALRARER
jgi:hypothetical protein